MYAEHEHLYEELEKLLNEFEKCIESTHKINIRKWYKRLHTSLDRVYRREAGISCPPSCDRQVREDSRRWQNTTGLD